MLSIDVGFAGAKIVASTAPLMLLLLLLCELLLLLFTGVVGRSGSVGSWCTDRPIDQVICAKERGKLAEGKRGKFFFKHSGESSVKKKDSKVVKKKRCSSSKINSVLPFSSRYVRISTFWAAELTLF